MPYSFFRRLNLFEVYFSQIDELVPILNILLALISGMGGRNIVHWVGHLSRMWVSQVKALAYHMVLQAYLE